MLLPVILAALAVAAPARPSAKELLRQGISRFNAFDDEGAAPLLQRVLAAKPPGEIAAKAHLYLGLIALNAVKPDVARAELRKALEANPLIELPAQASPKVELVFAEVRREMSRSNSDWEARKPPPELHAQAPAAQAAAPPLVLTPAETMQEEPPEKRSSSHALSLVLGGIGVACEVVAIYGGVQVISYNSLASNATTHSPVTDANATSALGSAQFWRVGWILFAAAGAAALGGGVLAW